MKELQNFVYRHMDALKHHKRYLAMLTALSMLVTFIVPLILVEPADSMSGILICGKTEHTHNAECYIDDVLDCDLEQHIHSEDCYLKYSTALKGAGVGDHQDNIDVPNAGGGLNSDGTYISGDAHPINAEKTKFYNPAEVSLYTLLFGELDQEAIDDHKAHWVEPGASLDANLQKASKEFFLGFASDFCAFIEGDFIAYDADAEGRMFVGGDLIFNGNSEVGEWNYQVGAGDYGHFDPISQTDEYGDLTGFASGIIGGKVYRLGTMGTGASANLNAAPPLTGVLDGKGKRHVNGYDVFLYPEEGAYKRFVVGNLKESLHLDEDYQTMGDGVSKDVPYSTSCNHLYYDSNCAICSSKTDHDYLGDVNELSQFYIYDDVSTILEKTFDTVRARADNLGQMEAKNVKIIDKKLILDASDIGDAETAYFKIDQWGEINDVEIIVPPNRVLAHDDYYTPGVETISELDLNIIISCNNETISLKGMTTYVRPSNEELNVEKHQISKRGEDNSTNNHPLSSNIVYNFYNATNVNFTDNCNLNGTILAPNADVTSPQKCPGHLSGAMIAKSFEGGLEFGYRPYRGGVDVLGLSAGYEVPVDKVVADNTDTHLPGAIFAVKEGDKILNLFESSEKTDFAVIPSKVDFTGKTLYQAEKFEQNDNANIVEDKESVNVNDATIKAPLTIAAYKDAECENAINEDAINVLGKFYIKTNQKVNITQNSQIYCDNNPQVIEAEGEDDDVDYVYTVYLNSPITDATDVTELTVNASTVATIDSQIGSVTIKFKPMSVDAGDDKTNIKPENLTNTTIDYSISNFPTGDNIYYQYYVNNERIGDNYNEQGYTPNELESGEYTLKTAGQFTITAKAYYLDNDLYRQIAEATDTVNVTVEEEQPLPDNMSLTFKVGNTEVTEITLGQTFEVYVNGMPADANPIYTFNGSTTGFQITPNGVGNFSVNVEVTKTGVTSVLLSKNITVNFPDNIGLTVTPSEYEVGYGNNITYTLTNIPAYSNVQFYYNDGIIYSNYFHDAVNEVSHTYDNAKLIGTIPVYAVISSNGLTKNIYFNNNNTGQSNITGKYKNIEPTVSATECEIGKEFKVIIPELPNGYVANVTFLGETKQAWGDGGTKEVSFYPQTEGTYEVKVTIKYDNNAEQTILQDEWVTVTQRVVDEDAENYTGTITFGGTFLPGNNVTATLNTDAPADKVEWIVYYYYESNTLASGTGTTANFTPQGVGDITYVFRHSESGKEIAKKTAKINAEFSITNNGNGIHQIQLAKIGDQSVGTVLEFRVKDLSSNTEKTLSNDYITIDGHLITIDTTSLGNGNFEFYINVRLSGGAETEWNSSFTNSNLVTANALMSLKRAAHVDTNTLTISNELVDNEEYDGIKLIVSDYAKDQYSKDAYVVDVEFYSNGEHIGTKKGYTVQSETIQSTTGDNQSQIINYININVADIENTNNMPITEFKVIVREGWLNIGSYIPRIRTKGIMATKTSGSGFKLAQNESKEIELGNWYDGNDRLESIVLNVYSGGRVKYTLFDSNGAEIADHKDKEVAIDKEGKVKIDGGNLQNVSKVKITAINSDLVVNQYSINKYVSQKIGDTTGIVNNDLTIQNTYTIEELDPPTGYKKTDDVVNVEVTEVVYLNEVETNNYLTYPAHVKTTIKAYGNNGDIFTTEMDVRYRTYEDGVNTKVDPYTRIIEIGGTEFTVITDLENNVTVKVGGETIVSNISSIYEFEYDGKKYCFDPSSKMIVSVPENHIKFENTKGILFRKVDDNGAAVKDVQIDLYKDGTKVDNTAVWNWVKGTTSEWIFEFGELDTGVIYTFRETDTGGLYEPADDIYMVKIDDTTVHYWTGSSTKPETGYEVIDSTSSSNVIRMENVPIPGIKPVIAKTKMDGTTITVGDGEKDAVFSLFAADGTEILSKFVVTGGEVTLDFSQEPHKVYNPRYIENGYLKPGEYYLKEISAPTGFEPAMAPLHFEVIENSDGTFEAYVNMGGETISQVMLCKESNYTNYKVNKMTFHLANGDTSVIENPSITIGHYSHLIELPEQTKGVVAIDVEAVYKEGQTSGDDKIKIVNSKGEKIWGDEQDEYDNNAPYCPVNGNGVYHISAGTDSKSEISAAATASVDELDTTNVTKGNASLMALAMKQTRVRVLVDETYSLSPDEITMVMSSGWTIPETYSGRRVLSITLRASGFPNWGANLQMYVNQAYNNTIYNANVSATNTTDIVTITVSSENGVFENPNSWDNSYYGPIITLLHIPNNSGLTFESIDLIFGDVVEITSTLSFGNGNNSNTVNMNSGQIQLTCNPNPENTNSFSYEGPSEGLQFGGDSNSGYNVTPSKPGVYTIKYNNSNEVTLTVKPRLSVNNDNKATINVGETLTLSPNTTPNLNSGDSDGYIITGDQQEGLEVIEATKVKGMKPGTYIVKLKVNGVISDDSITITVEDNVSTESEETTSTTPVSTDSETTAESSSGGSSETTSATPVSTDSESTSESSGGNSSETTTVNGGSSSEKYYQLNPHTFDSSELGQDNVGYTYTGNYKNITEIQVDISYDGAFGMRFTAENGDTLVDDPGWMATNDNIKPKEYLSSIKFNKPTDITSLQFWNIQLWTQNGDFVINAIRLYYDDSVTTEPAGSSSETSGGGSSETTTTTSVPLISSPGGNDIKIKNKEIGNVMKLKVEKKWAGDRGITEFRKTVTIQLKQRSLINGVYSEWTSYGSPVEVKEANDWQYIWENLPMYVNDENESEGLYYYTVAEADGANGYTSEVETVDENGVKVPLSFNQGGTITVTNTADTVNIPIQKIWSYAGYDKENVFIANSIKVKLQAKLDGTTWTDIPGKTLTLTSKGYTTRTDQIIYHGEFKDLPKGYEYRIVEVNTTYGWDDTYPTQEVGVKTDGTLYKMVDDVETECNGFEVTNTFNVDKGSLKLQKYWDGETGTRPYSVMLKLYRSSVAPSYTETDAPFTDGNIIGETNNDYKDDYKRLLQHSLYFYDANMCGDDVYQNSALAWRTNCHVGDEVPGGYHDAGDHVMFGLPQGYTASMLSWIYLEFFKDNTTTNDENDAQDAKNGDYFKMYNEEAKHLETILKNFYEFFENSVEYGDDGKITKILVQKGDGEGDHVEWCAPELQSEDTRIMIWSDQASDIAYEYAAALALGYLNFGDEDYLELAEKLYAYANGKSAYSNSFYPQGSGEGDDKALAAAWIYKAKSERNNSELDSTDNKKKYLDARTTEAGKLEWDGVYLAAAAATAYDTGDWSTVTAWIDSNYIDEDYYSVHPWGTARFNAMAQTATLIAAKHDTTKKDTYLTWVKSQMNQLLGDNDWKDEIVKNSTVSSAYGECDNGTIDRTGKPICLVTNFVPEGFDVDTPQAAHHRAASGWDTHEEYRLNCGYDEDGYTLIGALAGGPAFGSHDDGKQVQMYNYNHDHPLAVHTYIDDLHDYCCNEVAIDYNSGLVGAAAGLYYFYGTGERSTMIEGVEYGSYGLTGTPSSDNVYGDESEVDSVITSTPSVAAIDVENLETNSKAFAFNPTAISINEDENEILTDDDGRKYYSLSDIILNDGTYKIEGNFQNIAEVQVDIVNNDSDFGMEFNMYGDGEPYKTGWMQKSSQSTNPYEKLKSITFSNPRTFTELEFTNIQTWNSGSRRVSEIRLYKASTYVEVLNVNDPEASSMTIRKGETRDITVNAVVDNVVNPSKIGSIKIKQGETVVEQIDLSSGNGTYTIPNTLEAGTYTIEAALSGDLSNKTDTLNLIVKDEIVIDGEEFMDYSDSQVFTVNNTIGNVTWSGVASDGVKVSDDNEHYRITFTAADGSEIATFFKKTGKLVTKNVDAEITLRATDSYKGSTDTITIQIKERPKVPQLPNTKFLEEVSVIEIENPNTTDNVWSKEISNLPMYDSKGNPYYYYFEEVAYKLSENDYKPLNTAGGYLINSGNTIYMPYIYYNNGIQLIKDGEGTPATATVGNKFVSETQGQLPSTGGSGVRTYYYLGGVIMLLSIAGFTGLKRRERKRRKE